MGSRSLHLYIMFALPLVLLIVFSYYPMYGAQIAFKNFIATKGIWGSEWVGLAHFDRFIHSYEFWRVMRNTLTLSLLTILFGFPFPILLALSLNYAGSRLFRKWVQMITYSPYFISTVVIVGMMIQFLHPRFGIVTRMFELVGGSSVNWLAQPEYFKFIYVFSDIWQNAGFYCVIYLAALAAIDPSLHEAALVDGATKLQRMYFIDLPGLLPTAAILLILMSGNILNTGFEKILLLQNPLNLTSSEVIDTYVYKVGLTGSFPSYSYSTAIGLFKSIVGLILLVTVNKVAKRTGLESLW